MNCAEAKGGGTFILPSFVKEGKGRGRKATTRGGGSGFVLPSFVKEGKGRGRKATTRGGGFYSTPLYRRSMRAVIPLRWREGVKKIRIPCRERSPQRSRCQAAPISNGLVTQRGTERRPFPTKNQFLHTFPPSEGKRNKSPLWEGKRALALRDGYDSRWERLHPARLLSLWYAASILPFGHQFYSAGFHRNDVTDRVTLELAFQLCGLFQKEFLKRVKLQGL